MSTDTLIAELSAQPLTIETIQRAAIQRDYRTRIHRAAHEAVARWRIAHGSGTPRDRLLAAEGTQP